MTNLLSRRHGNCLIIMKQPCRRAPEVSRGCFLRLRPFHAAWEVWKPVIGGKHITAHGLCIITGQPTGSRGPATRGVVKPIYSGEAKRTHDEAVAERLLARGLAVLELAVGVPHTRAQRLPTPTGP